MAAIKDDQRHPDHLIADDSSKVPTLLRAAAIYGANASGKSNVVKAIQFAQNLIIKGTRSNKTIPISPYKLDTPTMRPSRFEFIFAHEGVLYSYGFVLTSSHILEEWLYATPNKKELRYFERITDGDKVKVEFGATFSGKGQEQKLFLSFVAKGTRPNQLFLTEAVDRNVAQILPIYQWFKDVLIVIPADSESAALEHYIHTRSKLTDFLGTFLRAAGTGIDGLTTEEVEANFEQYFPGMPEEYKDKLLQQASELGDRGGLLIHTPEGDRYLITHGSEGQIAFIRLLTQHRTSDNRLVKFDIDEESDGTQRLMHLTPALFSLKQARERVFIIDELDRRLHPLLSRLFLQTALDCEDHANKGQLIFTTHETSLLDLDILRRDEIWFVEKDLSGASHMYSLAEFKIRPDLKIEKGYLNGRFGAIPFIGDICNLGWVPSDQKTSAASGEER
ncbi:MAG TPA: ATP/GTP-binding protein [Chthonomonadaceae bacterium]|nr:ATP/GTP-binding protein [Chthonomonadaceae bacterium]